MPRPITGAVITKDTSRGTVLALRFTAYGKRRYITLGTADEGWTPERAECELTYVLGQVERGVWQPPATAEPATPPPEVPTFHEFASRWLAGRLVEGGRHGTGLTAAGEADLRWQLEVHLLPYFARALGNPRLDQITVEHVDRFRRDKVAEGRLGSTSINKCLATLSSILELATEYGHVDRNVAKGKRRRLPAVKATRTWLDRPEQIDALLRAAADIDQGPRADTPRARVLLTTLTLAGLRIDEALSLTWSQVNLAEGTLTIARAKTDAGVRVIDLLPALAESLRAHRAQARHDLLDGYVFGTATGAKDSASNIRRMLRRAVTAANEELERRNLPQMPVKPEDARRGGTTPHSLRRTFASILVALGEDPSYVMEQMGHTDPGFTLAVYSHAMRRRAGERDQLRSALERLVGRRTATPSEVLAPRLSELREAFRPLVRAEMGAGVLAPNGTGDEFEQIVAGIELDAPNADFAAEQEEPDDGRGGFRTCDLSRVKRALSH